jgi:hypothetical protein
MALKSCRECGKQVSTEAATCPHCGVRSSASPTPRSPIEVAGIVALLLIAVAIFAYGTKSENSTDHSASKEDPQLIACRSDWSKCADNVQLLREYRDWYKVQSACSLAGDERAKYGTPKWPWGSFGTVLEGNDYVTSGVAVAIAPDVQFQNGFGAWAHTRVTCKYDLRAKSVLSVDISEAR